MADQSSGGATGILGVIVGAIIVIGLGVFFLGGNLSPKGGGDTVKVELPKPDGK